MSSSCINIEINSTLLDSLQQTTADNEMTFKNSKLEALSRQKNPFNSENLACLWNPLNPGQKSVLLHFGSFIFKWIVTEPHKETKQNKKGIENEKLTHILAADPRKSHKKWADFCSFPESEIILMR